MPSLDEYCAELDREFAALNLDGPKYYDSHTMINAKFAAMIIELFKRVLELEKKDAESR